MSSSAQIEKLIAPSLKDMGYDVIQIQISGSDQPSLMITIDRLDEETVNVDDCANVSRAVSAILDVEDPIEAAYTLEVSSPGIDRQLTRPRDFERFAGLEAKVELEGAVDGQRRFKGKLLGFVDGHIHLETDFKGERIEIALPFSDVKQAKLVMSDALMSATTKSGNDN